MGCALHYQWHLTETAYWTKTFHKISLGFWLKMYCNLPPTFSGRTIFFLQYSGANSENRISSPERANCKSHHKSEPQWFQQSSFRFNDAEPSWSVKTKQSSAMRFVLYHWRVRDFSHRLQQGNQDGLCQKATPEIFAPFKFNCYLWIKNFFKLEFCFQKISTRGTNTFIKFTVFNTTWTCA